MTTVSTHIKMGRLRQRTLAVIAVALLVATAALAGCGAETGTPEAAVDADAAQSPTDSGVSNDAEGPASDDLADLPPTSGELIEAALASGDIDEPTSLLYRTWATFGDRALPEQYQGAPDGPDPAFFTALREGLDSLPDDISSQITPYLLRPSNPASAFTADGAEEAPGFRAAPNYDELNQPCTDGWTTEALDDLPFRIWVCNNLGDEAVAQAIDDVRGALETYTPAMMLDAPAGLGAPIPDDPASDPDHAADNKIDFYVLSRGWVAPYRDIGANHMPTDAGGMAISAVPDPSIASDQVPTHAQSGYVMLSAESLDSEMLDTTVVHELFHVLQNAHQANLSTETLWFSEATATWAEAHYLGSGSIAVSQWLTSMQLSPDSLLAGSPRYHKYAASVWALFLQQEGGPDAIVKAWQALEAVPAGAGNEALIDAISADFDVSATFPEFAMRLLNLKVAGDPITPRFVDADPSVRDGTWSVPDSATLAADPREFTYDDIPGLGYRYSLLQAPPIDGGTSAVTVSHNLAIASGTAPSVEAVVYGADGIFHRVGVAPSGADLCLSGRGDVFLVITNPSTDPGDVAGGTITVERSDDASCTWQEPEAAIGTSTDQPPATSSSPAPSTPPSTPPSTRSTSSPVAAPVSLASPEFCGAWESFDTWAGAFWIHQIRTDPTAGEVADMFVPVEPFLEALPNAVQAEIEHFRTTLTKAAGKSPAEAMNLIGTHEMLNSGFAITAVNELYCGAGASLGTGEQMASDEFCDVWATFAVDSGRYWIQMWTNYHPPYSAEEVAKVFGPIESSLPDLPDGAAEQVETLRTAALAAADQPSGPAGDILFTPEVKQAGTSVMATHGMYCSGE